MRGPYKVTKVLENGRYELKLLTGAYGKASYAAAQFIVPWKGEWTPEECAAFFLTADQTDDAIPSQDCDVTQPTQRNDGIDAGISKPDEDVRVSGEAVAVRSRGGFNNNPTLRSFMSAYKRLLCHTEIKTSESGNCLALEDITILSNSKLTTDQQINTSLTYNKITKEFSLSQETEEENDFDDLYIPHNEDTLSKTIKNVVEYIAGFVVKKIKIKISCEECCNALQSSRQCSSQESFINKRDFSSKADQGFLTYPSKDVIQLCLKIEKFIRENKKITQAIGKSTICKAVLLILEDNSGLFSSLENHNLDQDILSGHRYLIMKYVIEIYFDIRLKYEYKLNNLGKETVRNQFNKIVLFKGQ
ncbi:unnamed protein product [Pieris macdunnoughi]|uniref:Transposable element P transposase-like RNase H C-terminal domain-containing protein n=1 Tax=Pieris macdunnoughi TaxID=345717 RepID=A0A821U587_9NEOP|nr:unnamed protein product [Pieris macdunnoughi]